MNKIFLSLKRILNIRYVFALLVIINVAVAGYYLLHKEGWHVDEQLSYGHSNSTQGAFFSAEVDSFFVSGIKDIHNHWINGKDFHAYLTAQDDERFSYIHIWDNLAKGVHPPLFYALLHTVCSFTPDVFNKWQAGGLNLIIFWLTLIMFYKLSCCFIDNKWLAMIPVFLWGFSKAGFASVIYLRMYMLQTLFAVCLIYEVIKMIQENKADKKRLFLIFLYSSLGILTQYSSLIFSFIVAAVGSMILFYRKNWKILFCFALIMGLSVVVLFVVFPPALNVLMFSSRGVKATTKAYEVYHILNDMWGLFVVSFYSDYHSHIFEIYFQSLLGIQRVWDILLFVLVFLAGFIMHRQKDDKFVLFSILASIVILMNLYLVLFMPNMVVFNLRYYMLLVPLVALLLVYMFLTFGRLLHMRSLCLGIICMCVLLINFWRLDFKHDAFSLPLSDETKNVLNNVQNKNVLIYSNGFTFIDLAWVLQSTANVYLAEDDNDPSNVFFDENIKEALDKANYVFVLNSNASKNKDMCYTCVPEKREILPELKPYVRNVYSYRSGVYNFDVYEVGKSGVTDAEKSI